MSLKNWLRSQQPVAVVLWALAIVCVGLALANMSLLGIEPLMLAVLATVFAATASSDRGEPTDSC